MLEEGGMVGDDRDDDERMLVGISPIRSIDKADRRIELHQPLHLLILPHDNHLLSILNGREEEPVVFWLGIAPRKGSRAAARNNVLRGRESKRTGQMKAKPASFQQPKNFNLKVKKPKTKAITCGKDKREVLGMSRFTRGRA
jgi:hypothetical protein